MFEMEKLQGEEKETNSGKETMMEKEIKKKEGGT